MYTVKHTDLMNNEFIREAEEVAHFPAWPYSFEQTPDQYDFGFTDHSQFMASAASIVLYKRGEQRGVLYQLGRFEVINENGRVVATYNLPYQQLAIALSIS